MCDGDNASYVLIIYDMQYDLYFVALEGIPMIPLLGDMVMRI